MRVVGKFVQDKAYWSINDALSESAGHQTERLGSLPNPIATSVPVADGVCANELERGMGAKGQQHRTCVYNPRLVESRVYAIPAGGGGRSWS